MAKRHEQHHKNLDIKKGHIAQRNFAVFVHLCVKFTRKKQKNPKLGAYFTVSP